MRICVLGAGGGLGRNVVDAACLRNHEVVALVRDVRRAELPDGVMTIVGDASRLHDLTRAMDGAAATVFCVMPPLGKWLVEFRSLLTSAITAARQCRTRLVFPANVWIYGSGQTGDLVPETRAATPLSRVGKLRAQMEQDLREAGIAYAMVRLPEFYGPRVVTLTASVFQAALANRPALWPGPLDIPIEIVFMPDAAHALVEIATAPTGDGDVLHLPGARTTPRHFVELVYRAAAQTPRVWSVPPWLLSAAGAFNATLREVAGNSHLWIRPILLDGSRYRSRFGEIPLTPLWEAVATTLAWYRTHPEVRVKM